MGRVYWVLLAVIKNVVDADYYYYYYYDFYFYCFSCGCDDYVLTYYDFVSYFLTYDTGVVDTDAEVVPCFTLLS